MAKIITAKDYLARSRARSVRQRIKMLSGQMYQRALLETPFQDTEARGTPVFAEVDHGQWLALCECSGAEAVDYEEPIFFCFHCGNRANGGHPRPVIFPTAREEIERLLLERPVDDRMGTNEIDRAFLAKPMAFGVVGEEFVTLNRSWRVTESVEDLRAQNALIAPLLALAQATNFGGE